MKHAPGAKLDIRVVLDATTLTITACNAIVAEAAPLAGTGSGLGLSGMSERVTAAGGGLVAGAEGGEFIVRARLPIEPIPESAVAVR
jgi:signal transduction histidine kinase